MNNVYLNSLEDLVKLQGHMSEIHSAFIDSHRKAFGLYINQKLPFKFRRNKYQELEFVIGAPDIFDNICREGGYFNDQREE